MANSSQVRAVTWALVGFMSGLVFAVVILGLVFGNQLRLGANPSRASAEPPPGGSATISAGGSEGAPSPASSQATSAGEPEEFFNPLLRVQLDLDRPALRASLERRDHKLIEQILQERGPGYERLFAGLGIDADRSKQLIADILQVYRAKIEGRKYATQMISAQADLERRLKLELGDRYHKYLDYEQDLRADSESTRILDFVRSGAQPGLFADKLEQLQEVVMASDAYSARARDSLAAPLDELPQPIRGATVARSLEQAQATLALNARNAIEMARARSFSSAEIAALEEYCQSELDYYERSMGPTINPMRAELAKLEARLAASQAGNDSSPTEIQRLADRIERLKSIMAASPKER